MRKATVLVLALLALIVAADAAFAQCSMCRTALEQNGEMASGFNRGILFLLGMPYLVFGSIAATWFWRRRKADTRQPGRELHRAVPETGV